MDPKAKMDFLLFSPKLDEISHLVTGRENPDLVV